jgi:hypothetical protein
LFCGLEGVTVPNYPEEYDYYRRIITWSTDVSIKTHLRDDILDIKTIDQRDAIINATKKEVVSRFERIHMKDQKYLRDAWEPSSSTLLLLIIIFSTLSCLGILLVPKLKEASISSFPNYKNLSYRKVRNEKYY